MVTVGPLLEREDPKSAALVGLISDRPLRERSRGPLRGIRAEADPRRGRRWSATTRGWP